MLPPLRCQFSNWMALSHFGCHLCHEYETHLGCGGGCGVTSNRREGTGTNKSFVSPATDTTIQRHQVISRSATFVDHEATRDVLGMVFQTRKEPIGHLASGRTVDRGQDGAERSRGGGRHVCDTG